MERILFLGYKNQKALDKKITLSKDNDEFGPRLCLDAELKTKNYAISVCIRINKSVLYTPRYDHESTEVGYDVHFDWYDSEKFLIYDKKTKTDDEYELTYKEKCSLEVYILEHRIKEVIELFE